MTILTQRHVSRRTVLRGLGATLALPLLDSMTPALARAAGAPVYRYGAMYVPNGVALPYWTPATEGPLQLSPILQAIAPIRDRCTVVSGLSSNQADIRDAGPHPRLQGAWLTSALPRATEGSDIRAGISVDQVAARTLGTDTQFRSLQLGVESVEQIGVCASGYSCAYSNTVSWLNETTPIPMENNPRAVFERLFGSSESTDARARRLVLHKDRSLLDSVTAELQRFAQDIGPGDRAKVDQYVESLREVERRIQKAEEQAGNELPVVERPAGIPATFDEHVKLMIDLLLLAYQCDLTRVVTMMLGRESSRRAYPEIGVPDAHHPLSHHGNNPERIAALSKLNAYHLSMFTYLIEKMAATPEGDGTLLDHTLMLYGTGMGDPNQHSPHNLAAVVASGSGLDIVAGQHRKVADVTPLANLHLTMLGKVGVQAERFGNSTGLISLT